MKVGGKMTYGMNLKSRYSSQKDFYGKAKVETSDGNQTLYSYGTKVAEIKDGKPIVYGLYSNTTTRHIKEFLLQNGFEAENSKQIMKDYGGDKSSSYAEPITKSEKPKSTIYDVGDTRVFRIDDKAEIQATSERARDGFRHRVILKVDGVEVDKVTVHYQNRTWESYEYETAIDKLIDKSSYISPDEKEKLKKKFAEASHGKIEAEFKTIGNIASLGEVFGKTKKEKNEFKLRMLKTGMGNKGFEVPDDWDKLSEDEKEKRLDTAIKFLKKEE
jgi:hypothetical protein